MAKKKQNGTWRLVGGSARVTRIRPDKSKRAGLITHGQSCADLTPEDYAHYLALGWIDETPTPKKPKETSDPDKDS